jgi:hypothetical protein
MLKQFLAPTASIPFRFRRALRALDIPSSPNEVYLRSLKGKHRDSPCFVIGNGPSLLLSDLTAIHNSKAVSMAANKVYLAFADTDFRPNYYFVEDDLVLMQNYKKINELFGFSKLHPRKALEWCPRISNSSYYQFFWESPESPCFPTIGKSPLSGFYWGSTVVFSMLQFAFYMRCNPIYLVGVDFSFDLPKAEPKGIQLTAEGESNHFHPDYRPVGEKWNIPNLDVQLKTFAKVRAYAQNAGIDIYNATRGGRLEVFDRISLDAVFSSSI